jgi:hypothetical protein
MFCLDTAVQCLDLYQKLFEVPYPLVKVSAQWCGHIC